MLENVVGVCFKFIVAPYLGIKGNFSFLAPQNASLGAYLRSTRPRRSRRPIGPNAKEDAQGFGHPLLLPYSVSLTPDCDTKNPYTIGIIADFLDQKPEHTIAVGWPSSKARLLLKRKIPSKLSMNHQHSGSLLVHE